MARILHDIIYNPDYYSGIPTMLTVASPSLVIEAKWQWLSQSLIDLKGGITTDDFRFKINVDSAAVDESHSSWASISFINYAAFINTPIQQGYRVWVECTKADFLITDFIILTGKETINLSNTVQIPQHYQTAAKDILFSIINESTATVTFSSQISSNIFYGVREDIAFVNKEDFTLFDKTLAQTVTGLNESKSSHIYFENTVVKTNPYHNKIVTINYNTGLYEISQIETPLKKPYYPVTRDGTNPIAILGNGTDSRFIVPSGATGADLFWLGAMQVGEERTYTSISNGNAFGVSIASNIGEAVYLNYALGFFISFANANGTGNFVFDKPVVNETSYYTLRIRRKLATGTMTNVFDVEAFVDDKKLNLISSTGSMTSTANLFPEVGYNLSTIMIENINTAFSRIGYWQMNKRWMSRKEITEMHLGEILPAEYKYIFNNIVAGEVIASGTSSHLNCSIQNHFGNTVPLFNT